MPRTYRRLLALSAALCGLAVTAQAATPTLEFQVDQAPNLNVFVRQGPVAAHILLRSDRDPRLLVVFPAGNSGVGLWFDRTGSAVHWSLDGEPKPVTMADAAGRPLYGVTFDASVRAPDLAFKQAVLSSVRVLRDYQALGSAPAAVLTPPTINGRNVTWARDRLDGAPGYRLTLKLLDGRVSGRGLTAGADGRIALRVTALSGETPLTPLSGSTLLTSEAAPDPTARQTLEFLSYRQKFLAGSWRFDTYFGRDTLMSLRLLMPALQPEAIEDGLRSVFARLSQDGQVAHEEGIGEFAVLEHRKTGVASDAPIYDYKMIDANYMLAPVAGAWLLDDPRGRRSAQTFLASADDRQDRAAQPVGADLVTNLRLVAASASAFAVDPRVSNLIHLKPGYSVGQWRDSNDGLGGGRSPFDVNAVFVPAALTTGDRLVRSGLLDPYLTPDDRKTFARLGAMAQAWRSAAPPLFKVTVPAARAREAVAAYAASVNVSAAAAREAADDNPVVFHALSLDADGSPVRVENSDEGFELLFGDPSPAELTTALDVLTRPFPAGLMTGVGLVVADPAFASPQVQARFSAAAYHGTVVWSWQQAIAAAGVARQLQRTDLPASALAQLRAAQTSLWSAIDSTRSIRNSELWSWTYADGGYKVVPFGANAADADEANAAQLWSTVYLALHDPTHNGGAATPPQP